MMGSDQHECATLQNQGYLLYKGFLNPSEVRSLLHDAKAVFARIMKQRKIFSGDIHSIEFDQGMAEFFNQDKAAFQNTGKNIQNLISLHRLGVSQKIIEKLKFLGMQTPNICTRPVLLFNSKNLADEVAIYKTPPHQDWRSMQGSLNSLVVWVPLTNVDKSLGALRVIPESHLWGLQDTELQSTSRFATVTTTQATQFVDVETEVGDALFFSAFLVHESGDNLTEKARWSCHFRYNDLDEAQFIARGYPSPYTYKPSFELVTENFPKPEEILMALAKK